MAKTRLPKGIYPRKSNGSLYYLVSLGRDDKGKQRWANFKDIDEAITQRETFTKAKTQQGEAVWSLGAKQRADCISAYDLLKNFPDATLVACANFYLKNHLSLVKTEGMTALLKQYFREQTGAEWEARHIPDSEGMRSNAKRSMRCRLKALGEKFGDRAITELTASDMKEWARELKASGQSDMSLRHILNRGCSFFKWAEANHYCNGNPLDPVAVKRPRIHRGDVLFYPNDRAEKVLKVFRKHGLIRYAVFGMIVGIRPEEMFRLTEKNIRVDDDGIVFTLGAGIAKTQNRRVIEMKRGTPIGDMVWAWLEKDGKVEFQNPIIPPKGTFLRKFEKFRDEFGFDWIKDGLRHTAGTNAGEVMGETFTVAMLGNTISVFRAHYKGMTSPKDASKFYCLRPSATK